MSDIRFTLFFIIFMNFDSYSNLQQCTKLKMENSTAEPG